MKFSLMSPGRPRGRRYEVRTDKVNAEDALQDVVSVGLFIVLGRFDGFANGAGECHSHDVFARA